MMHLCNALKSVYLNHCRYLSILLKYPGCSASMTSLFFGRIGVSGSHLNPDRPGVYKPWSHRWIPRFGCVSAWKRDLGGLHSVERRQVRFRVTPLEQAEERGSQRGFGSSPPWKRVALHLTLNYLACWGDGLLLLGHWYSWSWGKVRTEAQAPLQVWS